MIIKTLQWNIGGGKIRKAEDDPSDALVYRNNALEVIIATIKKIGPDIITLQESHSNDKDLQAKDIAASLGLPFFVNDIYAPSHLENGQHLSQTVISRYPLGQHHFELFLNPHIETTGPDGSRWVSHDKGATSCVITMPNGAILDVRTSHSVPYRKFDIDAWDEVFSPVRNDMARKLSSRSPLYLYQGDLNHDDASVKQFLPTLFENNLEEVILDHPTTPKGRWYDHVLYRGIKHVRSVVVTDVLTDHFPVYSEFEVPDKVI
jgi:endonuclease/exonuclease/phosphatase (EEP) superfamily protein YafD